VRESERLGRIVDDLLDLSLIEAQAAPTREPTPIRLLVDEAVERLSPLALAGGIPLRTEPIADDLLVVCDAAQLVSAITNLLDNAVKYSEPGQAVLVDAATHDGRVVLRVQDHGIGIPTRDLERIFERFYRVDKARSRATGGTGLGLSIVRHVVEAHGGDVTVQSTEGEGSTFWLALPLADAETDVAEAS
jgi:two-component system, OmpR family, sensor histidine kinase SenX3